MKTVLITGGSRGIGAETVKVFAKNGYTVFLNYNKSQTAAENLKKEINQLGFDVHLQKADISNEVEVKSMLDFISRYAKHLDVLVNNAGVALYNEIQHTTLEQYDQVMDVNCKGTFLVTKYTVPLMLKKFSGTIINVSSLWGLTGASCESVYSMSKFAVVGFSQSLEKELAESGISVKYICPPIVLTDMCKNLTAEDIAEFEKIYGQIKTPSQVAEEIFEMAENQTS